MTEWNSEKDWRLVRRHHDFGHSYRLEIFRPEGGRIVHELPARAKATFYKDRFIVICPYAEPYTVNLATGEKMPLEFAPLPETLP